MSEYRSADDAAILLTVLFQRGEEDPIRVSKTTIKKVAQRENLKGGFVKKLKISLKENHDWILLDFQNDMFAAISGDTLRSAKIVKGGELFKKEERKAIRKGQVNLSVFAKEIDYELDLEEEEEEA